MLGKLFQFNKKPKSILPVKKEEIQKFVSRNRKTLSLIENWIDDDAFESSWFNYGVPDYVRKDLNRAIDENITYSDLILYLSHKYFEKVNYLEIGVSVGKNFYQVLNGVLNLKNVYGFDIERINPVLERELDFISFNDWDTPEQSIKKDKSSLKKYSYKSEKTVHYLNADVWDEDSWKMLSGNKFNIIFSDALHTPEAILFEFEMIVKYDLLSDRFVILWDDILEVSGMDKAFFNIYKKYNKQFDIKEYYLTSLNGWLGEHESPHSVGVISNFNFK